MNLLIFSGNSLRNRDYAFKIEANLKDLFGSTHIQDYQHWATGQEWIDLPHELETLKATKPSGKYGVFAKSIGTVLTVQAIQQGIIAPKFLLLCGIPLGYIVKDFPEFGKILASYNIPTVIIQNDEDPVGSSKEVHEYLNNYPKNHAFTTTKGTTHGYEDYELLRQQLDKLTP